jgi:hypothetical protein
MLALKRFKTAPWGRVLAFLAVLAVLTTLALGIPEAYKAANEVATTGGDTTAAAWSALAAAAVGALVLSGVLLFYFTMLWVMFDIPGGWRATRQFFRDLPENFRRLCRFIGDCFWFVIGLPGRLWRGLVAVFRWLGTVPSLLRAVDWGFVAFMAVFLSILTGTGWLLWPTASGFVNWLPTWIRLDHEFLMVLWVDTVMAMLATTVIVSILTSLVRILFKTKRSKR